MEESTDQLNQTTEDKNNTTIEAATLKEESMNAEIADTNTNDTSLDSGGKKVRKRTVDRGLDGNYWGKIAAIACSNTKRKRKTVERLYVNDIALNLEDENSRDNEDNIETKKVHDEIKKEKERQQSSRKVFYKQKTFILSRF